MVYVNMNNRENDSQRIRRQSIRTYKAIMKTPQRKEPFELHELSAPSGYVFLIEREAVEACLNLGWHYVQKIEAES